MTNSGMVVGTPLYMPPEQAAGSSVDLPVDVYAMGCVLFEMLTGRPPFVGESRVALLTAHLRDPIPKLADVRKGMRVAPELQTVIDQALAKKQTERYPNAGAMLAALERVPAHPIVVADGRVPSGPAVAPENASRPISWWRLAAGAVVLVAAVLLFALMR
ncbi:MAG TPA: hypothetical protein VF331_28200 [Polyangiales bacterium]